MRSRGSLAYKMVASLDEEYDVIIVGAGVVGGALATVLGRDGRRVLCVERSLKEPERIVGELLQPGGYDSLVRMGISDAVEGIDAQEVYGYGIFLDGRRIEIDYSGKQEEKRVAGRSFHNGRFVRRLRELAGTEPCVDLVEGNVKSLYEEKGHVKGVIYSDSDGTEQKARAKLTIGCDGCSSRLRKMVVPAAQYAVMSQFYGLILRDLELPFPSHGHVVLAEPSPVLFYPISSTEVRCLVDIPGNFVRSTTFDIRTHMKEFILPQVPEELKDAFLRAIEEGEIKSMPNRSMPALPGSIPGALLLGDSFNMRHPLTGGGMTVALNDAESIRKLLRDVPDLSDRKLVDENMATFYKERKPLSSTINILANALYSVFCVPRDPIMKEMRSACYDYLSKAGRMSEDPICMLGGLKPYPYLLIIHFAAVAVYACGRLMLPFPTISRMSQSWSLFRSAFNILKPLIDDEDVTFLARVPISHIS